MIICRRCGHSNESGATFCGSCGSFLEWTGEQTAESEAPGPPSIASDPTPPDPAVAEPEPVRAARLSCPRCATPNEPSRAFCRSCGETLDTQPDSAATTEGTEPRPTIGAPILVVAALGAVAIAVALLVVLRPGSGPSAGPGVSASAPPTGRPGSPSPTVTTSPTLPPEPTRLAIGAAEASSFALSDPRYGASNVFDGALDTSWQEGARTEEGQWIEVGVEPATLDRLVIFNGWQWTEDSYFANLRLRDIQVIVDEREVAAVTLEDRTGGQAVALDGLPGSRVRIVIVSTYESESRPAFSPNSPFDDAAISEVELYGQPAP